MEDTLRIPSITGVDLAFRIAGPGGRSYAFIIDWHIRLVLSLAWYVIATLLLFGTLAWTGVEDASVPNIIFFIVVPATAIYVLYHPVLEVAMNGRTPGKRMAGIRIVTQSGEVPGVGAILIRNVLRVVDSLPGIYVVGLVATMLTEQAVRIGDMAAGTLLVYDEERKPAGVSELHRDSIASLGLDQLELVRELLERWQELGPGPRLELANRLLVKLHQSPADTDESAHHALLELTGSNPS
jgi:uncharacterized RDD family membrane protein YckC